LCREEIESLLDRAIREVERRQAEAASAAPVEATPKPGNRS
jgi:hypothetical protein